MKLKIFLFIAILLSAVAVSSHRALLDFYDRYESMAVELERKFAYEPDTANAIKHATAAFDVFNLLRKVLPDDVAQETVILMGFINEYIEHVLYPGDPDSAREIMKDLHNNYVGIAVARLTEETDSFRLILSLAHNRTLIVKDIYNPLFEGDEPEKQLIAFGFHWFNENRAEIDKRIHWKLQGLKELHLAAHYFDAQHLDAQRAETLVR